MSEIHTSAYSLTSVAALNAVSQKNRHEGVLIRVGDGYGCVHPWPELGDLPVAEQLDRLRSGRSTPLIAQALKCAEADGSARREGRSLFQTPVPKSHWLILPGDDPGMAQEQGFGTAKIKIGRNLVEESRVIGDWAAAGFRVRLDANESFSIDDFLEFWEGLGSLRAAIEWVEDPAKWEPNAWGYLRNKGIPLAVDRELEARFEPGDIGVVKPAVSSWIPSDPEKFSVTSYMDHAIGQMWAAVEASRLASGELGDRLLSCGLGTHRCFEKDSFFERIQMKGGRIQSPGGTGLGFDDLLEGLPWKRLT